MEITDTRYDDLFVDAANAYLPAVDWRWLKAQAWQESRYDPNAVSPAGAVGVMQFMEGTWGDMERRYDIQGRRTDATASIMAGAAYMSRCVSFWKWPRPTMDRYALALASYNAGRGNIREAQRVMGDPSLYAEIIIGLPQVTGHHSKETIGYVSSIFDHYRRLVTGGG
ncbi:MAG: transglycosylase SLT domain-containing protein [Pseudomonadota bacterium]